MMRWLFGKSAEDEQLEKEIPDLIERSRAGDQLATANLLLVGENAAKGNPKAMKSHAIAMRYLDSTPPIDFGADWEFGLGSFTRAPVRAAPAPAPRPAPPPPRPTPAPAVRSIVAAAPPRPAPISTAPARVQSTPITLHSTAAPAPRPAPAPTPPPASSQPHVISLHATTQAAGDAANVLAAARAGDPAAAAAVASNPAIAILAGNMPSTADNLVRTGHASPSQAAAITQSAGAASLARLPTSLSNLVNAAAHTAAVGAVVPQTMQNLATALSNPPSPAVQQIMNQAALTAQAAQNAVGLATSQQPSTVVAQQTQAATPAPTVDSPVAAQAAAMANPAASPPPAAAGGGGPTPAPLPSPPPPDPGGGGGGSSGGGGGSPQQQSSDDDDSGYDDSYASAPTPEDAGSYPTAPRAPAPPADTYQDLADDIAADDSGDSDDGGSVDDSDALDADEYAAQMPNIDDAYQYNGEGLSAHQMHRLAQHQNEHELLSRLSALSSYSDGHVVGTVALANSAPLTNARITRMSYEFGQDAVHFCCSAADPHNPASSFAGAVVGMARRIQEVRHPHSRISDFSPDAGWELGE